MVEGTEDVHGPPRTEENPCTGSTRPQELGRPCTPQLGTPTAEEMGDVPGPPPAEKRVGGPKGGTATQPVGCG